MSNQNKICSTSDIDNKHEREYGMDLFRLFAVILITVLHVVNQHYRIVDLGNKNLPTYLFGNLMEYAAYCGVDCFGILSGYLMVRNNVDYKNGLVKKLASLWFQCIFYSVVIFIVCSFVFSQNSEIESKTLLYIFTPILSSHWWYVTSYVGLLALVPMLNLFFQKTSYEIQRNISVALFFFFSVLPIAARNFNVFGLENGYSVIWLFCCYFWGGFLRINMNKIRISDNLPVIWCGVLVSFLGPYLLHLFLFFTHIVKNGHPFRSFVSPTVVLEAFFLLLLFRRIKITSIHARTWLPLLSSCALGIYLLQCHVSVWRGFILKSPLYPISFFQAVYQVPLTILLICATGIMFDLFRQWIFRILKIKQICSWMNDKAKQLFLIAFR